MLSMLRVIETKSEWHTRKHSRIGRPSYDEQAFLPMMRTLFVSISSSADAVRSSIGIGGVAGSCVPWRTRK